MKVVVFGAAGWVGRAVLENLQEHHAIRAFDRGPDSWQKSGPWSGGEIVHGDIADYDTVDRALDGVEAIIHVAVYAGPMDACWIGDERVTPQPGGFYGGWITSAVVGPFKGESGTWGW